MKKLLNKFFGFCLLVASATFLFLGLTNQINFNLASATTTDTKTYNYTISNSENYIEVTGSYDENSNDETYIVGKSYTTFNAALSDIITDANSETNTITINFNNFTLVGSEQTISLESSLNFVFTGSISSTFSSPVFKIFTTYANSVYFQDIQIENNDYDHIIEIDNGNNKSDTKKVSISFADANLYSYQSKSYAVYLSSSYVSLSFDDNLDYSSTYLFNYLSSISATLKSNFSIGTTNNTINITVPFDITSSQAIINATYSWKNYINFIPLYDFYTLTEPINNNNSFYMSPIFNINFDENDGEYINGFTEITSIEKYTKTEIDFPTSNDISRENYTLVGWYGKLEINSTTWYFDSTMLENFASANYDLANIGDYFALSLDNLDSSKSFSSYVYDSTNSNFETYLHAMFFTNIMKMTPSYIAVWSEVVYKISFVTNCDDELDPVSYYYGDTIESFETVAKLGYTFDDWYIDSEFNTIFSYSTMPAKDLILYAKWLINSVSITFIFNNGDANIVRTGNYQDEINYPEDPELIGYTFLGWVDENNSSFSETNYGTESLFVYAEWERTLYTISYISYGGGNYAQTFAYYGDKIDEPSSPSKTGYTFDAWYTDSSFLNQFDFENDTMPANNVSFHANWIVNSYKISFVTNCDDELPSITYDYDETIASFDSVSNTGYSLVGWYLDSEFNTIFPYSTMPAQDLILYAKWQEKENVEIDVSAQTYSITDNNYSFKNFSSLSGFSVSYLVGNTWVSETPTDAGTYDVKITRSEDSTYKSFSLIVENGLVIEPEVVDILWLIILLFCFAFFEFVVILIIKYLQRLRTTKMFGIALPALIASNKIILNNQFILLIVSIVLALLGFILMIVEIVKWHKSNIKYNLELSATTDKKDEIVLDEEFEEKFKTKHDDSKYKDYIFSRDDIEEMLKNPNYFNENNKLKDAENQEYVDLFNEEKNDVGEDDFFNLIDDDDDNKN